MPALFATAPVNEATRLYVVEQGGLIRVLENGAVRAQPFLDLRSKVRAGGEQGLLGLAFDPDYATSRTFVVNYTSHDGDTASCATAPTARRPSRRARHAALRQATRTRTTTAAWSPTAPTASCTRRHGRRRLRRRPGEPRAEHVRRCSARSSASTHASRQRRSRRAGCATRGASRSTGRPATCTSATSARARSRRSTGCGGRAQGLLNFGWDVYEGTAKLRGQGARPRHARAARRPVLAQQGLLHHRRVRLPRHRRPGAAGRYFYGDYCSGTVWSLKIVARQGPAIRVEPFSVKSLTAFGEDAAGELYLVSQEGPCTVSPDDAARLSRRDGAPAGSGRAPRGERVSDSFSAAISPHLRSASPASTRRSARAARDPVERARARVD